MAEGDFQTLNSEVCDSWERNADFWNQRMQEGNEFHRLLIAPAQDRLLNLKPREIVLDIGCGNGQFARHMAALGADVVAIDASPRMIQNARGHASTQDGRLEYAVVDATNPAALTRLGEHRFDAAVSTMMLMDMASIEPLLSSLRTMLKPRARFVFSICHPCFNSGRVTLVATERASRQGTLETRYSISISEYIRSAPTRGVAMKDQPSAQYYFDRPLSMLFTACFNAGFVLDGIEEPTFHESRDDGRPSWWNLIDIPPVLVARMTVAPR